MPCHGAFCLLEGCYESRSWHHTWWWRSQPFQHWRQSHSDCPCVTQYSRLLAARQAWTLGADGGCNRVMWMLSVSQGFVRQWARVVSATCVFPHNFRKLKTLSESKWMRLSWRAEYGSSRARDAVGSAQQVRLSGLMLTSRAASSSEIFIECSWQKWQKKGSVDLTTDAT